MDTGILGRNTGKILKSISAANRFFEKSTERQLLSHVGRHIASVPQAPHLDKRWFQRSYAGTPADQHNDVLTGRGVFFITEGRKLFLDATAGHYQMTWGYNHPLLASAVQEAIKRGIVWDCHSNLPGDFVKQLAWKLVEICNRDVIEKGALPESILRDENALNTVLLGTATGSVACSTAMKLAIKYFEKTRGTGKKPVFVSINGNYHGTDIMMQRLRGMWPEFFSNAVFETVEPNDCDGLEKIFRRHGNLVAAFFCEPLLMNREAILIKRDFLQLARKLTAAHDALMVIDEIQTGFWCPEMLMHRQAQILPDAVIVGKGLSAGFHPISGVIYKKKFDSLKQYDSISTNGNAPLPCFVALQSIRLIEKNLKAVMKNGEYFAQQLHSLAEEYHGKIVSIQGQGYLSGIKFKDQPFALEFHRRCLERGIWLRVHAYYPGHSTALTKFALVLDKMIADFTVSEFRKILNKMG